VSDLSHFCFSIFFFLLQFSCRSLPYNVHPLFSTLSLHSTQYICSLFALHSPSVFFLFDWGWVPYVSLDSLCMHTDPVIVSFLCWLGEQYSLLPIRLRSRSCAG
jgi:hypothetical protein